MQLFWHRRDLRTTDNLGLADAAGAGDVVPVFCFDDDVLVHAGAPRVAFMLDALRELRERYRELGTDLLVRHGDPSAVIPDLVVEYDAERVVWNHDYSGLAEERDEAVRAALDDQEASHEQFHDAVLHEPGAIRTNDGDPYSVYTYFWKKWRDREKDAVAPEPTADDLAEVSGDELRTVEDLGFEEPAADIPDGGTRAARERLESFCEDAIYDYAERRDYPADECTSRLSQDLKFGTIGIRELFERTEQAIADAETDAERESVAAYRGQLAWREFYAQVLSFNQDVVTENNKDFANPIEWREDPEGLQAWKDGKTGYPIVDAGMRQLREEAFVHNRLRMVVASFLTKDLLVDWRAGYDWFRERLVDHDTANDNGGWQWAASTGTDAQPYFRVFNPETQGERYDPDAEYITEYVPELRGVPAEKIHSWTRLDPAERAGLAPDYPAPIVDHANRREQAIETFERARGDE